MNKFKFVFIAGITFFCLSEAYSQWLTNGNNVYYNSGNVGLGTSNPGNGLTGVVLDIAPTNADARVRLKSSGTYGSTFIVDRPNSSEWASIDFATGGSNMFGIGLNANGSSNLNLWQSSGNTILTLTNSEKVGISTTNPTEKLEISNGNIFINNSNYGLILTSPNGTKWKITIDNNGNLITNITTKINEPSDNKNVNIYPIPSNNILNIHLTELTSDFYTVELFNIDGKLIFLNQFYSNSIKIDMSSMSIGTFVLIIKDSNENIIKREKIIKE